MARGLSRFAAPVLAAWALGAGAISAGSSEPFGVVTLDPDFSVEGQGKNIDSIAFFEAEDPEATLMFVTSKDRSLVEVWRYPFVNREQPSLTHESFAGSGTNGVAVDQLADRLFVTVRSSTSTVAVFELPELEFVFEFIEGAVSLRSEPNLDLLRLESGELRAYVSADDIVYVHDATDGAALGSFEPPKGLETLAADEYYQALYIPDEGDKTGVYAFDPDGAPYVRDGASQFGDGGIFSADAEGIAIFRCHAGPDGDEGQGWIVVADQRFSQTDFEFFDRATWQHLGTVRLTDVNNTDGIASTQRALPLYPQGILAAIDDDERTVGVGWDRIRNATGLACPVKPVERCRNGVDDDDNQLVDGDDEACRTPVCLQPTLSRLPSDPSLSVTTDLGCSQVPALERPVDMVWSDAATFGPAGMDLGPVTPVACFGFSEGVVIDTLKPDPGDLDLFLVRESGRESYGAGSDGTLRIATSGDCP